MILNIEIMAGQGQATEWRQGKRPALRVVFIGCVAQPSSKK